MKNRTALYILLCLSINTVFFAQKRTPFYNQKNLNDFTIEGGKATYTTKDGIITGHTALQSPNTFLATKKTYGDFKLTFEVKVDAALNSGVQIRSRQRETSEGKLAAGRFYGPQVEIESKDGVSGYVYGESMGNGWRSQNRNPHNYFKIEKWNQYKIIAKGAQIKTYINGHLIEDLTDEEAYKSHPKGHIGLQVHAISKNKLGTKEHLTVQWKNLQIVEL
ncbi:hypothetical protein FHR24_000399 [Wenyingzhuangia heitensis]|uniref:3-keto-alpha-glucoside-1,2-lyase/3-keto-2-hydroxy-glucal hydratase domain-containing protein n=1 Tax=Wenyingzhuangia heitensis TaxID=1487859 RepID=A0ABX0U870_9FLAO|nr:DUF1080 domain-containing protein [Wenyingzhuangia heitensis]NIJ43960.1 hypothetical protein [Wenyingzhuangia heitensis]